MPSEPTRVSVVIEKIRARSDRPAARARDWIAKHPNGARTLAALCVAAVLAGSWLTYELLRGLPGPDELKTLGETTESTTIYDAQGRRVFTIPTEYRIEVPLARMSTHLRQAMVAVEDARFYEHDGIDGIRVVGAVLQDIRERRAAEGASTITQQLARTSFLNRDKTLRRKVKEAILAQRLEKLYSKDDILELYLNKVYFGDGLYGAEAAARGYFGKPASDLTLTEGALLAGLVKAPSASNPAVHPERAINRRNVVLQIMLDDRLIDRASYDAALAEPLALHDSLRRDDPVGVHFKEYVRRELVERFGKSKVYEGRLQVYTTIDPAMQKAAEDAVRISLDEIDGRGAKPKGELQAALLALDPASGEVRAMVGGRDTESVGLNRALQSSRQPGSAFKPFVYAAVIENGYSPASVLANLDQPVETYQGAWMPEDEHSTASTMTIRTALRTSSNRAAVRMLEEVGIDRAVTQARRLGLGTVPSVPSLALGSGDVTLQSITSAYAAFAQSGIVREPVFIRRVEDEYGAVLFEAAPVTRRAMSETTAFLMANMLADVVDTGTAIRVRRMGFKLPAGGKTGTTNDFVDAWFVGFTPTLVTGVWVGFDQPRTILKNGFAGQLAVPLWARFMTVATRDDADAWFEPPPGVSTVPVCRISGMLPVEGCKYVASMNAAGEVSTKSMVYTDYFVRGTEPQSTCTLHMLPSLPYPEPYFNASDVNSLGNVLSVNPVAASADTLPIAASPEHVNPDVLPTLPTAPPEAAP